MCSSRGRPPDRGPGAAPRGCRAPPGAPHGGRPRARWPHCARHARPGAQLLDDIIIINPPHRLRPPRPLRHPPPALASLPPSTRPSAVRMPPRLRRQQPRRSNTPPSPAPPLFASPASPPCDQAPVGSPHIPASPRAELMPDTRPQAPILALASPLPPSLAPPAFHFQPVRGPEPTERLPRRQHILASN